VTDRPPKKSAPSGRNPRTFRCPACRRTYTADIGPGRKVQCICGNRFYLHEADFVDDSEHAAPSGTDRPEAIQPVEDVLPSGSELGRCRIIRVLGSGSTGTVYLARHTVLEIPVAVKVLNRRVAASPEFRQRFLREARTAAELDHPNIVRVLDAGEENGVLYQVIEYVEGGTAADLLREHKQLPVQRALRIARDACRALVEAEKRNIVHRDIKPQNIIITPDGQTKLADLGLARHVADSGKTAGVTQTTRGLGTPYYMPPEQIRDARRVDTRADIYALGATLFHLLAGEPPFTGRNSIEVLKRHLDEPAPSILERRPDVPRSIDLILKRCLEKGPQDRYQSAGELLHDLEVVLRNPHVAAKQLIAGRMLRRKRSNLQRTRMEWIALLALLVLVLLPFAWQSPPARPRNPESAIPPANAALDQQIQALQEELSHPRVGLLRQARIWAQIAALEFRANRTQRALESLQRFAHVLRQTPMSRRRPVLADFTHAVLTFLSVPPDDERLRETMSVLRGMTRDVSPPRNLVFPIEALRDLAARAELHARVQPEPDYWAALIYTRSNPDEAVDFLFPQAPAVTPPASRDEATETSAGESEPPASPAGGMGWAVHRRLLWRLPMPPLFRATFEIIAPPGNAPFLVTCALFTDPAWLYIRRRPCPLAVNVRRTDSGKGVVVVHTPDGMKTLSAPVRQKTGVIRVQIAAALPEVTVRIAGKLVYSGRPVGDAAALPSGARAFGVFAEGPVKLRNLALHLPAEELVIAARGPRFYCARPFGYGVERVDRTCMVQKAAASCDRPPRPGPLPDPEIFRALVAGDGTTLSTASDADGSPACLIFRTPIMSATLAPAIALWYVLVAIPESGDVPPTIGRLDLWNESSVSWTPLRQLESSPVTVAGKREILLLFGAESPISPTCLTPTGEYVVRWTASAPSFSADTFLFAVAARRRSGYAVRSP